MSQSPARVVVVSDFEALGYAVGLLVQQTPGLEIRTECVDPRATLDIARKVMPQAAILVMPVNPSETVELARQLGHLTRVIVMYPRVHGDQTFVQSLLRVGVQGFITHERDHHAVAQCIAQVIAGKGYFPGSISVDIHRVAKAAAA